MDQIFSYNFHQEGLVLVGTILLTYFCAKRLFHQSNAGLKKYPPSIGCLPVIGSLPYLPKVRELHRWSLDQSYKLGGVFSFSVGSIYTVLLTSHEAIREAFVQRSVDYADRVSHFTTNITNPEGKGIISHRYDENFKKYHQLSLTILKEFGFGKSIMETRIRLEVVELIKRIKTLNGQKFNPKENVLLAVQSIISRIIFGQPILPSDKTGNRIVELLHRLGQQFMSLLILDILPWLRVFPFVRKRIEITKASTDELFHLIHQKIDNILLLTAEEKSFVSCFIEKEGKDFDRTQLAVTIRDLVAAGFESVFKTILWAFVQLANNPDVQGRLQKEIDSVVPRDRLPSLDDMSKMKYVEATILELMRIKTLAPIGMPRQTTCDTEVSGFFVPKGASVFAVLYAVHMDVNVWEDPLEFRPERFIDTDGNIINKDLVIPFSLGKRSCLGEQMARQELFLFLTGLVQQFDIRPPEGLERIECQEHMEFALGPTPYEVCLVQRDENSW